MISELYLRINTYYMQIESQEGHLSRKSRGILYKLKSKLNSQKFTLKDHINAVFGYEKNEFSKKQFFSLIQKYDDKLLLSDLDELFDELDESRNSKVFYYHFKEVYESIHQQDDPNIINRDKIIKTASRRTRDKIGDIITLLTQVRKLFLQSEEILQFLLMFSLENSGYVSIDNIKDIFNNLEYNKKKNRQQFIQNVFQGKQKILLQEFYLKLDLNQSAQRSSINKKKSESKMIEEVNQSQFIIAKLKQSRIDESISLTLSLKKSIDSYDVYEIGKIPSSLQPYYIYGSQLQIIFAEAAKEYIETNSIFIDSQNPPYSRAYQWVHLAETHASYQLFQMAGSVLEREKGRRTGLGLMLQPKDIIQGNLGDCYFLSAVAGVVEKYPELIYRLFVLEKNPSHLFGVRLFIEGAWRTILLDACFPVDRNGNFCAAQPHHFQIWVMLLEKAWAKVYGSYDNIHSGYNEQGLNSLSGAPSIYVSARENDFLKRIQVEIKRGSIVTCATSKQVNQLNNTQQQNLGIFQNHAYSLLDVYSDLRTKQNAPLNLLKVRNPWGKKQWQGGWGFRSNLWTKELRQMLNYTNDPKDGSFFMSLQDFIIYFDHVNICRVNLAYTNSWIEIEADRDQFKAVRFQVKERGDYYFTIYQENPRRHSGTSYQKSKSWIFLSKIQNGNIVAIGSGCRDRKDNTIEVTLEPGEYIILSKVQWKRWQKHSYCLSSYGPKTLRLALLQIFDMHIISNFIESKARLGFGKRSFYDKANILKRTQFSPQEGYGFILINNQQNKIFNVTIAFQQQKGLTILPPYSLPLQLSIFPGEQVICKFLVDPTGFALKLKQSYNFSNGM